MSRELIYLINDFLISSDDGLKFRDKYISRWKTERDRGDLLLDDSPTSEALSSIFCLVDLFNPDNDREEYELDEKTLRTEIRSVLSGLPASNELLDKYQLESDVTPRVIAEGQAPDDPSP